MVEPLLADLAHRYMWWLDGTPPMARLLCQLMQLGTYEDVRRARRILGDEAFREALRNAPPGVLDARSWNFWHLFLGLDPIPPMPERTLPWTVSHRS